jgi:hypothetical protein
VCPQFEQLLVLLQPKERDTIVAHFKRKSAETNTRAEKDKHDDDKDESAQKKKSLLASAGGLVVHKAGGNLMGSCEEGAEYSSCVQDEEERRGRMDNQMLANFFSPVQRQIVDIIRDVSPSVLFLDKHWCTLLCEFVTVFLPQLPTTGWKRQILNGGQENQN